jgi:hypothetical protein
MKFDKIVKPMTLMMDAHFLIEFHPAGEPEQRARFTHMTR